MKIIERPEDEGFQQISIGGINVFVHNKDSSMLNGIQIGFQGDSDGWRIPNREPQC